MVLERHVPIAEDALLLQSLKIFLKNASVALPKEISLQNLKSSIVELVYPNGQHLGNGLIISHTGLLMTTYHCASAYPDIKVYADAPEHYHIEGICDSDIKTDLALLKAKMPSHFRSYGYNIQDKPDAKASEDSFAGLLYLTRRDKKILSSDIHQQIPPISASFRIHPDHETVLQAPITMIGSAKKGDSGSPVIGSLDSILTGMLCYSNDDSKTVCSIPSHEIIRFVSKFDKRSA